MGATIMPDDGQASKEDSIRPSDVEFVGEMTDANVIRVVVIVLRDEGGKKVSLMINQSRQGGCASCSP